MSQVLLQPKAEADLDAIWDFIAEDSEDRADAFIHGMVDRLGTLATMPRMGLDRSKIYPDLRSFVIDDYIVFYQPLATSPRSSALYPQGGHRDDRRRGVAEQDVLSPCETSLS